MWSSPVAITAAWMVIAGAAQGYLWFARPSGVPRHPPAGATVTLPRDGGDARLSQTFRVQADGLREVTLYPVVTSVAVPAADAAASAGPDAQVEIALSDITDPARPRLVHRTIVQARELAADDRYRLAFSPQSDSSGHLFELDLLIRDSAASNSAASSSAASGSAANRGGENGGTANGVSSVGARRSVAFTSIADNVYHDGMLRVNGRPEWGDLAFSARAAEDTPFAQFLARALPAGWPRGQCFWIALLLACDALCALLFWSLISSRPGSRPAPAESAG